jgi:hypothetical protein
MSTKSLDDLVLEWSHGNNEAFQYWMEQLNGKPNYITSIQVLQEFAREEDRWKHFLMNINSDLLAEYLKDWRNNMIVKESKKRNIEEKESLEKRIRLNEWTIDDDDLRDLLEKMQLALKSKISIFSIQKSTKEHSLIMADSCKNYPLRAFVNREDEILLALESFHSSHNSIDKVTLIVCSQMFGQGKTRFARELTNPLIIYKVFIKRYNRAISTNNISSL